MSPADEVAQLREAVGRLEAVVAAQAAELAAQRAELTRLTTAAAALDPATGAAPTTASPPAAARDELRPPDQPTGPGDRRTADAHGEDQPVDRRTLLRRGAAAAAGAVAATTLITGTEPAAAANGDPLVIGQANFGTGGTSATTLFGSTFAASGQANPATSQWGAIIGLNSADTAGAAGVYGATGSTIAANTMYGVRGAIANNGAGVYGEATTTTPAIGVGLRGRSKAGPGLLLERDLTAVPTSGTWQAGSFVELTNGDLWLCVLSGTPGTWRKVAGPQTAGAFHLLAIPNRIYDSRAGFSPLSVQKGAFVNTTRTIQTAVFGSGIPTGAVGVLVNLAVTNTGSGGFGSLYRTGLAWPGNASINWSASGTSISNQVATGVNAAATFDCKIAGTADVIVDALGFWQ